MDFLNVRIIVNVALEEKYMANTRPNESVPVPAAKKSSVTFLIILKVYASGIILSINTRTSAYNLLDPGK